MTEQMPMERDTTDDAVAGMLDALDNDLHNAIHDAIYEIGECSRIKAVVADVIAQYRTTLPAPRDTGDVVSENARLREALKLLSDEAEAADPLGYGWAKARSAARAALSGTAPRDTGDVVAIQRSTLEALIDYAVANVPGDTPYDGCGMLDVPQLKAARAVLAAQHTPAPAADAVAGDVAAENARLREALEAIDTLPNMTRRVVDSVMKAHEHQVLSAFDVREIIRAALGRDAVAQESNREG